MMRAKTFWGEDANEFNPDRWMKEDSSELDKYYMPVRAHYQDGKPSNTVANNFCSSGWDTELALVSTSQRLKCQRWPQALFGIMIFDRWILDRSGVTRHISILFLMTGLSW
jgi:hypothetical protein